MASIQVLEIRPLEVQVEDLSDDMTGSILGGALDCVAKYIDAFESAIREGDFNRVPRILVQYFQCLASN